MYYAFIASYDARDETGDYWTPRNNIAYIDFVRGRKDGKARLARLLAKHADLLPQKGWKDRIQHKTVITDDQKLIEELKTEIRLRCATIAISRTGKRRLWADTPGAPAGCYDIDYTDANRVLTDVLDARGLYRRGG